MFIIQPIHDAFNIALRVPPKAARFGLSYLSPALWASSKTAIGKKVAAGTDRWRTCLVICPAKYKHNYFNVY